ncbi:IS481 family transposase [Gloeobacter kilaueensis]|uniref:IS481 family transposase n=1 Tax=Gloeobacter kilaueensis TaxID=1416614 RepID=UPI0009E01EA7|nr:IS481 family transposase [Gloeobacter kilaueensis]
MPAEALVQLRSRLAILPERSGERKVLLEQSAGLFGVSVATVYRALREQQRPKSVHRADRGSPRLLPRPELERYCEVIAAMKLRTLNQKGRHVSTARAIALLEEYGMDTPSGFVQLPKGLLAKSTVNHYLDAWGYDLERLTRQPPAVRFQAEHSNECWHFDLSPSDLKHLHKPPAWVEPGRGNPTLMLFSVVDDRSGVCFQEYRCVYGEDVEAALRFLFGAMSPKEATGVDFGGIPAMLYADNGPIARSRVFQNVLECLGIKLLTHMSAGSDGTRVTARAKGKVERPFRTVKEAHETLYHFHQPQSEAEANLWLQRYLMHYNDRPHRSEPHSRLEDWQRHLPSQGIRQMCSWERFCTFAREPERRKVGADARVTVEGVAYQVEPDLAGETVVLWWGLFDNELYVEKDEQRYGPYLPVDGPIPLHRYRKFKKTRTQERSERIATLATRLGLPRAALEGHAELAYLVEEAPAPQAVRALPFRDLDPYQEFNYPSALMAKRAIAQALGCPLAKLSEEERAFIDAVLGETLSKKEVLERVRRHLAHDPPGEAHAD